MGMKIDKPRRDDKSGGVDNPRRGSGEIAHGGDPPALDPNVAFEGGNPRPLYDSTVFDKQFVIRHDQTSYLLAARNVAANRAFNSWAPPSSGRQIPAHSG